MKRSPLTRKTPLSTRRKPVKRADADPARLAWVRSLDCARCQRVIYDAPIEAHHPTGAGLALKAPDADAFPLCGSCHRELHSLAGNFKGWKRDDLREWQAAQSAVYRVLWRVRQHDGRMG